MSAKQEILDRIARALADRAPAPAVERDYRGPGGGDPISSADLVELFEERVIDYKASVHRCGPGEIAATVGAVLAGRGAARIAVPEGLPAHWLPTGIRDTPPLSIEELDQLDGVLTACTAAIAETGTIVLAHGPGQGRRALTLVPDLHLVVVRAEQVVRSVPEAIALLDPLAPMTWISGPSATSDIELSRVEGVHGPRTLDVILVAHKR